MEKRIIYKTKEGGVAIITPSPKSPRTLEEIAKRGVPTGLPYKIVDKSVIDDWYAQYGDYRGAWEIDEAELTDGIGSEDGVQ